MSNVIVGSSFNNKKEEKYAAETISPGHLIELNSDDKFQNHSTAGGSVAPCFADIDKWQGNDLDDDYSADDLVAGWYAGPGDIVRNAVLVSTSSDVSIGDFLESNGDGKLRKHEPTTDTEEVRDRQIVGFALEAVTLSGDDEKIDVQII